ncbi:MAG: hypothetical protein AB1499_10525 [Nitrospirota bacterium]
MKSSSSSKGPPSSPLSSFAKYIRQNATIEQIRDPEFLAEEFRRYFGMKGNLRKSEFIDIAKNKLGINKISPGSLPSESRGLFGKLNENIEILYKEDDWEGSQEFTLGHEIREIIGVEIRGIDPEFSDAEGEELENEADAFAAALHMEKESFTADMINCGYDPIYLHEIYHKAYIGIVSRMASVSNLQTPKGNLWCSVFEIETGLPDGYLMAKCFHRSPKYNPRARYRVPNSFFPKRGMKIKMQEHLLTAYSQKAPVYIKRLTGLDFWEKYCLSVIIRPIIWNYRVAKLIVICVPERQSYLFDSQLKKISPIISKESFQLL